MAIKRLNDQDRAYLARTDHEVIKALEAELRKGNPSAELKALLDSRDGARTRIRDKKAPGGGHV